MAVSRADVRFVLAVTGVLLGGVACYLAFDAKTRVDGLERLSSADGDLLEQLVDEKTELQKGLAGTQEDVKALRTEVKDAHDRLAKLASRIDALENK